ncbi:MAG: hypothetical protein L3J91_06220 [Thermoplasmata archaeon]|nr:hypothetical protein [Thermoplasmata archaeon]
MDPRPLRATEARLRRNHWKQVTPGLDGLGSWLHRARGLGLIHSIAVERDGELWEHVSLSRQDDRMPTWEQVRDTFREVCGDDALGVVVVPPKAEHVDLAEVAHVWRCLTRRPLPDFSRGGRSI